MKLAAKYYLKSLQNFFLIELVGILGIILSYGVALRLAASGTVEEYTVSGFELAFMFFTLIIGPLSFQEAFRLFQQNAICRKSQFFGWAVSLLTLSVTEGVIIVLLEKIPWTFFNYCGVFTMLYDSLLTSNSSFLFMVQEFLWVCMICLFLGWLGFTIAILYYRLSKIGKILVSILVPGTLFILLPIADLSLLRGGYAWLLEKAGVLISGYLPGGIYPMVPVVSALVGSAILAALSWLMMRRAEVNA